MHHSHGIGICVSCRYSYSHGIGICVSGGYFYTHEIGICVSGRYSYSHGIGICVSGGYSYSHGIDINLEFSTNGDLDPRGYQGVEGVQTYYQSVEVTVVVDTAESDEALEALAREVERRCPLFNLLKDAGVEVISNWEKR